MYYIYNNIDYNTDAVTYNKCRVEFILLSAFTFRPSSPNIRVGRKAAWHDFITSELTQRKRSRRTVVVLVRARRREPPSQISLVRKAIHATKILHFATRELTPYWSL
jgi:hypothetical protein